MSPNGDSAPAKKAFSIKKEISGGGKLKNKAKGFSGGASGRFTRPQALGLSLRFSFHAQIQFELGCKNPPNV